MREFSTKPKTIGKLTHHQLKEAHTKRQYKLLLEKQDPSIWNELLAGECSVHKSRTRFSKGNAFLEAD